MARPQANTVQIGLRIEKELLEKIERVAQYEKIDKMSWIRRALATFLKGEEIEDKSDAIADYINLRIDEEKLKKVADMKNIPRDLQEARLDVLNHLKQEAMK